MDRTKSKENLDPRVMRTQSFILDAFMALLKEKGFKFITVKEITERAGINRSTFYAHYQDKFDLLNASLQAIFSAELERKALNICQYSREELCTLFTTVCRFVQNTSTNCKSVDSQFELIVEKQVRRQVQDLIEMWLGNIEGAKDLKPVAVAASWAIYGLAEQWSQDPNREPLEVYADRVLPLVIAILPYA